jgi:hypothetical protein
LADGHERLDEVLEEAFRIEASGWKEAKGTAITSRPDTRRFYRDVARWAAGEGWLRIAFLRLDGHAVAMMYVLETDRTLYYLKGGYDPGFERHSPGMVLLASVIEDAFGRDVDRVELLGGDERYSWPSPATSTTGCASRRSPPRPRAAVLRRLQLRPAGGPRRPDGGPADRRQVPEPLKLPEPV